MGANFFVANGEFTIGLSKITTANYLLPGLLLALIIFGIILIAYMLYKFFHRRSVEKHMLIRAEIAGEYERKRKEEQKRVRKQRVARKKEEQEKKPAVVEQYLKEEEKQVMNILKDREGRCEQGTLRIVTGMPKSSLSRILKELEDRNIIYKEKRGKKNMVFLRQ